MRVGLPQCSQTMLHLVESGICGWSSFSFCYCLIDPCTSFGVHFIVFCTFDVAGKKQIADYFSTQSLLIIVNLDAMPAIVCWASFATFARHTTPLLAEATVVAVAQEAKRRLLLCRRNSHHRTHHSSFGNGHTSLAVGILCAHAC